MKTGSVTVSCFVRVEDAWSRGGERRGVGGRARVLLEGGDAMKGVTNKASRH
jgi:hypothetical protein